ncbi:protein kinase [bacterium]|nr:protein kinase [bacterium]
MQAAEGLNEAHRKKMTHRDIKSANIMITENNRVKIMDFGLAKLSGRTKITKTGTTVGTISYMSPEQVKGEKLDHRSDIWSLGVVLYEMISGKSPFQGEYEQAVVYSIMNEAPEPLTALRTGVPMELERIVNKLLAKDPDNRYQHIDELPVDLKAIDLSSTSQVSRRTISDITTQKLAVKQKRIPWKIIAASLIAATTTFFVTWILKPQPEPEIKAVSMFTRSLLPSEILGDFAISPDGTKIVYSTLNETGVNKLYLFKIDQLGAIPINNTEDAYFPFFSPDSKELCFYADQKLKKVSIDGGPAQTLCDVSSIPRGGTWGDDGTIIFAAEAGLLQISASGGIPEVILEPDSGKISYYYRWPEMLPGSKAVLYTVWEGSTNDEANIAVYSLETGDSKILIKGGTQPFYSPTGHILFRRPLSYWAVPFDVKRLKIAEPEVLIQEGVLISVAGETKFRVSRKGTLVYSVEEEDKRTLVLVDRRGIETHLTDIQRTYWSPRFSPDGLKVAIEIDERGIINIWIHDVVRNTQIPLTSVSSWNDYPCWTPDGKNVTFRSYRSGVFNIYWQRADGIGEAKPIFASKNLQYTGTWSNDGTLFAFTEVNPTTKGDIWIYASRDSTATPFINTLNNEFSPAISPDGKWIAYTSDRTGKNEIYITNYPDPSRAILVSTKSGIQPVWAPNGRELFYREGNRMMVVSVETQPSLRLGVPKLLFEKLYFGSNAAISQYDIHPASDRFLMIKTYELPSYQFNVILNWFEVLKEKMAGAGE